MIDDTRPLETVVRCDARMDQLPVLPSEALCLLLPLDAVTLVTPCGVRQAQGGFLTRLHDETGASGRYWTLTLHFQSDLARETAAALLDGLPLSPGCQARVVSLLALALESAAPAAHHLVLAALYHALSAPAAPAGVPSWRIGRLMDYLQTHFTQDCSAEALAQLAHYNPSYLRRLFRDSTGVPLHVWVRRLRMGYASLLLRDTDSQVAEIASQAGYTDLRIFYRHFKLSFGVTPSVYRAGKGKELPYGSTTDTSLDLAPSSSRPACAPAGAEPRVPDGADD